MIKHEKSETNIIVDFEQENNNQCRLLNNILFKRGKKKPCEK